MLANGNVNGQNSHGPERVRRRLGDRERRGRRRAVFTGGSDLNNVFVSGHGQP